ncbi:MAG: CDP-alcohol phosphatidyltransferase family protein [Candidatus Acidiferrum sp.]
MAMKARIWTVPNQITLLRLGFLPFFLILVLYNEYRWALVVLVFVALTDAIDGFLARRLHQKSALGAYLDPIADKLLLSSSFVVLAMERKIAWWLTMMVISRDALLLVVAAVIIIVQGYRPFPPSLLGKATTFFEITLVALVVFAAAFPNERAPLLIHYLAYVVAVFVVVSGFHYAFVVARRLHTS